MVVMIVNDQDETAVMVQEVNQGSSAQEADVQPGDVILAVDGRSITDTADLMAARREHVIGDTMTLTLLRDGQTLDVDIVLRSNKK